MHNNNTNKEKETKKMNTNTTIKTSDTSGTFEKPSYDYAEIRDAFQQAAENGVLQPTANPVGIEFKISLPHDSILLQSEGDEVIALYGDGYYTNFPEDSEEYRILEQYWARDYISKEDYDMRQKRLPQGEFVKSIVERQRQSDAADDMPYIHQIELDMDEEILGNTYGTGVDSRYTPMGYDLAAYIMEYTLGCTIIYASNGEIFFRGSEEQRKHVLKELGRRISGDVTLSPIGEWFFAYGGQEDEILNVPTCAAQKHALEAELDEGGTEEERDSVVEFLLQAKAPDRHLARIDAVYERLLSLGREYLLAHRVTPSESQVQTCAWLIGKIAHHGQGGERDLSGCASRSPYLPFISKQATSGDAWQAALEMALERFAAIQSLYLLQWESASEELVIGDTRLPWIEGLHRPILWEIWVDALSTKNYDTPLLAKCIGTWEAK